MFRTCHGSHTHTHRYIYVYNISNEDFQLNNNNDMIYYSYCRNGSIHQGSLKGKIKSNIIFFE